MLYTGSFKCMLNVTKKIFKKIERTEKVAAKNRAESILKKKSTSYETKELQPIMDEVFGKSNEEAIEPLVEDTESPKDKGTVIVENFGVKLEQEINPPVENSEASINKGPQASQNLSSNPEEDLSATMEGAEAPVNKDSEVSEKLDLVPFVGEKKKKSLRSNKITLSEDEVDDSISIWDKLNTNYFCNAFCRLIKIKYNMNLQKNYVRNYQISLTWKEQKSVSIILSKKKSYYDLIKNVVLCFYHVFNFYRV